MTHKLSFLSLIAVVGLLSACSKGALPEQQPLPDLTYAHLPPVSLNVASINVTTSYDSTKHEEDVSDRLPVPPDVAIRQYIQHRFNAVGNDGTLTFDIQNAKVTRNSQDAEGTMSRWLGINQTDEYKASVKLAVSKTSGGQSVYDTSSFVSADILANRNLTVPQRFSLAERDAKLLEMTEKLINEIDPVAIRSLGNTFKVLKSTPEDVSPLPEMWGQQYKNSKQLQPAE